MIFVEAKNFFVKKRMLQLGIPESAIAWNVRPKGETPRVWIRQHGREATNFHGYVTQNFGIPYIAILDPQLEFGEPELEAFNLAALRKAWEIHEKGIRVPTINLQPFPVKFDELLGRLEDLASGRVDLRGGLVCDLECNPYSHEIVAIGFAWQTAQATYDTLSVPLEYHYASLWSPEQEAKLWLAVARILENENTEKIFQNYQFDCMVLWRYGIRVAGPLHDTLVLMHLYSPLLPKNLEDMARLFLQIEPWKGVSAWMGSETLFRYNQRDCAYTFEIFHKLRQEIAGPRLEFYERHMRPLLSEALAVCNDGWSIDDAELERIRAGQQARINEVCAAMQLNAKPFVLPSYRSTLRKGKPKPGVRYTDARGNELVVPEGTKKLATLGEVYEDEDFNPGSSKQVIAYCNAVGIEVPKDRKSGNDTTNELAILKMQATAPDDPVLASLLDYREASKILSTYCAVARDEDGRVRFSLTPGIVVTSRFSSKATWWETGFNAQNQPKHFRSIVVPTNGPDWTMWNMDLKQADPHIVGWLSGCDSMLDEMRRPGGDLHVKTASAIYGTDIRAAPGYDKDKSRERQLGKMANNALNYGMQAKTFQQGCLKKGLPITLDEAEQAVTGYFKAYPEVLAWQESIKAQINQSRQLTSPFGRVLRTYGMPSYKTYNEAMSWIPQTTVADVVNEIWIRFMQRVDRRFVAVRLQCHDAIAGEVLKSYADEAMEALRASAAEVRFNIGRYECNIAVDISLGPNLRDQK